MPEIICTGSLIDKAGNSESINQKVPVTVAEGNFTSKDLLKPLQDVQNALNATISSKLGDQTPNKPQGRKKFRGNFLCILGQPKGDED